MNNVSFAAFLGGWEILLILFVVAAMAAAGIGLLIWLVRETNRRSISPPIPAAAATRRVCGGCGKEISAEAPQGLCPACLMNVALGSEGGNPAGSGERKPPPPPADIARHFPHLEILELLGQGGMGAVYKARHRNLDRMVALKILPPHSATDAGFAERFNREARALAKLSHPNIVAVYDFGNADGLHYLIMEYVDGLNLRQLEQAGKLTPREALQIVPQICEALQFAHDEGIVHRDIKPENVLLDKKGRAKIADFGLARILGREPESFRLTGAKDLMGTPHYMAPEQIEHPQAVDHRADIYSLGVVFYEMLTGELPLGRFAPPSSRARGMQIDVRLDEVVLRALEKEPERRYQHASEVKTDVETISNSRRPGASVPLAPDLPPTSTDRDAVLKRVQNPAIGLFITGILCWAVIPFTFVILWRLMKDAGPGQAANTFLSNGVLPMIVGTLMILAGQKMKRLESYGLAVAACVLPMVVLLFKMTGMLLTRSIMIGPADLVGAPMGLWALVVLSRPEVKAAFEREAPGTVSMVSRSPLLHLAWALPAVAVILALGFLIQPRHNAGTRVPAPAPAPTLQTPSDLSEEGLTAALEGAQRELLQVRLTHAEEALALAETKFKAGLISQYELDDAKDAAELLRAEIIGDPLRMAGVRLASAERRFQHAEARFKAGLIGDTEYRNAKNAVEIERVTQRATELRAARSQLADLRRMYTDQHPQVQAVLRKVAALEQQSKLHPDNSTELRTAELEFRLVAADGDTRTPADELADSNDRTGQEKLRVLKEVLLDSSAVATARIESSQTDSKELSIVLKSDAAQKLAEITAANVGRRLAIVWRGRVLSAPVIRTQIKDSVSVTGNLSEAETQVLLDLLRYKPGDSSATREP